MKRITDPEGLLVIIWKVFSAEGIDGNQKRLTSHALYVWAAVKVLWLNHIQPYKGRPIWVLWGFGWAFGGL